MDINAIVIITEYQIDNNCVTKSNQSIAVTSCKKEGCVFKKRNEQKLLMVTAI